MKPLRDLLREPEGASERPWYWLHDHALLSSAPHRPCVLASAGRGGGLQVRVDGRLVPLTYDHPDAALIVKAVNFHALLAEVAVAGERASQMGQIACVNLGPEEYGEKVHDPSLCPSCALDAALSSLRAALEGEAK